MLIKYQPKVEHVKCIPLIPDVKSPKSYSRNQIMLLPGHNEVTDDEWENIKPHIAVEIKSGEIVQINNVVNRKDKSKKARSLKEVPANIAQGIIATCNNPETLKKWFAEEGRDEVILAVTKRMRKLKIDPDEVQKELENDSEELLAEDETETGTNDDLEENPESETDEETTLEDDLENSDEEDPLEINTEDDD